MTENQIAVAQVTEAQMGEGQQTIENKRGPYKYAVRRLMAGYEKSQSFGKVESYSLGNFLSDLENYFSNGEKTSEITTIFTEGMIHGEEENILGKGFNEANEDFGLILAGEKLGFLNKMYDTESLFKLAKMNQRVTASFYRLIRGENTRSSGDLVLFLLLSEFSETSDAYGAKGFRCIFNGARAQAGLMDFLQRNGYQFKVPEADE